MRFTPLLGNVVANMGQALYYEDLTGKADFVSQEEHPIVRILARKIK